MSETTPTRIAMWSGPRNISTALMRAWDARGDTAVRDEPLYAHYLAVTGLDHPGAEEIIAHDETDWRAVVAELCGPVPGDRPIAYHKHMAHHLLPEIDTAWVEAFVNCFLIRAPAEMLTSLMKVIAVPDAAATGLPQQVALFDRLRADTGRTPIVLDARDVLEDPPGQLERLCAAIGVPYTERMLAWPAGPRATDGIWSTHWYASVEASTGFAPYRPKNEPVPDHLADVLAECERLYAHLAEYRFGA